MAGRSYTCPRPSVGQGGRFSTLEGTPRPDVIESVSFKGPPATIQTHHNVGGLPHDANIIQGIYSEPFKEVAVSNMTPREPAKAGPFISTETDDGDDGA